MKNRVKLNISNLKEALSKSGIKKQDLAQKIGVSRETFSRWLSGKVEFIEEKNARHIADILKCPPSFISPEIKNAPRSGKNSLHPNKRVSGDDLVRIGLFSHQWKTIFKLVNSLKNPDIVNDYSINLELVQSLGNFFDLRKESSSLEFQKEFNESYELFDIVARRAFIQALESILVEDSEAAEKHFRRVLIQGQSEWIVALSYLGYAFCQLLAHSPDEALKTIERGLEIFNEGFEDLTSFATGNLHLLAITLHASNNPKKAQEHLMAAKERFKSFGYLLGIHRIEFYELYMKCVSGQHSPKELENLRHTISERLRGLPELFKLETIYLCLASSRTISDNQSYDFFHELIDSIISSPYNEFFPKRNEAYEKSSGG